MPKQQRARAHKESKGIHGGARKTRLSEVNKVLISNGGCLKAIGSKRTHRARKILAKQDHDVFSGHKDYAAYI